MGLPHSLPSKETRYSVHTVPIGHTQFGCDERDASQNRPELSMVKRGRVFFEARALLVAPASGRRFNALSGSGSYGPDSAWLPVRSARLPGVPTRAASTAAFSVTTRPSGSSPRNLIARP